MRVAAKSLEEARHLLCTMVVMRDAIIEINLFGPRRKLPVEKQIADFQIIRLFGELLDRIAAMQQDARLAVDIGDLRLAARPSRRSRGRSCKRLIRIEAAHVYDVSADCSLADRESITLSAIWTEPLVLAHWLTSRSSGAIVLDEMRSTKQGSAPMDATQNNLAK